MNCMIKKYKSLAPAVKASFWFMVCSIIQKGIAFFVVPIYTRMLTTSEYGTYSVFLSWTSIFYIFATLNMSAGVFNNGMLKYEDRRNVFTSSIQGLSSLICLLCTMVLLAFHDFFSNVLGLNLFIIVLMMIQIFFQAPYNYWTAKYRFEFKYRPIVATTLVLAAIIPLFSIFLMFVMKDRISGIIIGNVLGYSIVGTVALFHNIKSGRSFYDKGMWLYCLRFNVPLIPHYLSYVVLGQADRVMINLICGASDAGIYALAYQISLVINIVTAAIDGSFNPWTYQKLKEGAIKSVKKVSNYLIGLFAVGVLGLILIAPEVIAFAAPDEYSAAKWVVPPVVCGCYYLFIAGTFMRVEFYHENNKVIMIASAFTAFLNVGLNALFIPKFGFIAAAYTTLVSYILFALFHYTAMRLVCKKNKYAEQIFDGKFIFCISIATMLVSALVMSLYEYALIRYTIILFMAVFLIAFHNKIINLFSIIGRIKK